jgi:hypothetical protein
MNEDERFAAQGVDVPLLEVAALGPMLDAMAREISVCRELLELLVDWAGARDRPPSFPEPQPSVQEPV